MLEVLGLISALLFTAGSVAYWLVSRPLRELPNFYELQAQTLTSKEKPSAGKARG